MSKLYEGIFNPEKINILDEEFEIPSTLLELIDVVESATTYPPKDKRTLQYKQWRDKVNEIIKIINKRQGYKYFVFME